jgi:hypothetical protein
VVARVRVVRTVEVGRMAEVARAAAALAMVVQGEEVRAERVSTVVAAQEMARARVVAKQAEAVAKAGAAARAAAGAAAAGTSVRHQSTRSGRSEGGGQCVRER